MKADGGGPMEKILIYTPYITLGQFLKRANIVSTGGEVKPFLATHTPLVQNEKENRRGRKLYPGMIVEVDGKVFEIVNQ